MNEKTELILKWVEKAEHDLATAQIVFHHLPSFSDTITFHCQQAVEKYLKAFFIFLNIPFRKTDNLNYLLVLISEKEVISDILYNKAVELDNYSVELINPDLSIELTNYEIKTAIDIATELKNFILNKMNLKNEYDDISE